MRHGEKWAKPVTGMGQTLPMDSAPVPPDVRCCSKSDHLRHECEMTLRANRRHRKAGLLPLSVFGALFVSAARIIPGHPGVAAFRKSAKQDAF